MSKTKKYLAVVAGIATTAMMLAVVAVPAPAQAQTIEELQEQVALLLAQITALTGGTTTTTTTIAAAPVAPLTMGSRGPAVVALQEYLISQGHVIPAGATGYYGAQTAAAVTSYQKEKAWNGPYGYYGPLTQSWINADLATVVVVPTTTGGLPAGCTSTTGYSPSTGAKCDGESSDEEDSITTDGVEGTISVTSSSSGVASTVRENDQMVAILGLKVEAKTSDMSVQRVEIDLGADTKIYNKIYSRIYVTDGSKVLASKDLNSSTVTKSGSNYYITLAGFDSIIKKDNSKTYMVKADVRSTVDTTDLGSYTVQLAPDGVRALDGAGIQQYGGGTTITRSVTVAKDLAESASLKISTNSSSPKTQDVVASDGSSDDELDKLELLRFDLKGEKDDVLVTDLVVDIVKAGTGGATASSTVYIYEGSTEIDNASYSGGSATFSDIDLTIPKNTTKTYIVKVDIRNANGTVSQISADIDTADVTSENSVGTAITETGSATGETMYVRNAGIEVTLGSTSISKSTVTNNNISTTTSSVAFNVTLKAVGDDIIFGTQTASTTFGMVTYTNDASAVLNVASSTSFAQPTGGDVVTTGLSTGQSFKLSQGGSVTMPVTFTFVNRNDDGSLLDISKNYKAALDSINWATNTAPASVQNTDFMSGKTEWRSASAF